MAEHLLFSIRNFAQEFGFFGETHFYTKRWASNVSKPTLPQTKDPNPCMIFLTVLLVKNHRKNSDQFRCHTSLSKSSSWRGNNKGLTPGFIKWEKTHIIKPLLELSK